MERGDGFWTSENKGWKTRRAEQDRYRRALDQQIEERKKANHSRRSHFRPSRETEPQKIQDPVQHLMPWLNNGTPTPATTQVPVHVAQPLAQPLAQPMAQVQQQPQQGTQLQAMHPSYPPNQAPPNYYYVAHPLPMPQQTQPHSHHPQQQHPQGAFAYFGSTPLPPPAEYAPSVATQMPAIPMTTPNPSPPMARQDQPQEIPEKDLNSRVTNKKAPSKPHVAQTSEELPPTQSADEYRMALAKQVEEKRRQDAEKVRKEHEEEEKLQRKIAQDQEKLRHEHAQEIKRAQEKEEAERVKMSEKAKYFELTKKKLDAEVEAEKLRQKSVAERQQQLKDAASNSRAALSTSPSRYYGRDKSRDSPSSWAWESVVVPTRRSHANIINHLEEGGGDCESHGQQNLQSGRQLPSLPQSGKSHPSSVRGSARSRVTENEEGDHFYETESNAGTSSRTYLLSDREDDMSSCGGDGGGCQGQNEGPPGTSKSSEEVGACKGDEDMMMCPRCARSFSSTDITYPESPAERLKILNFLDNIQRKLREDRAKLLRDGFDWSKS